MVDGFKKFFGDNFEILIFILFFLIPFCTRISYDCVLLEYSPLHNSSHKVC